MDGIARQLELVQCRYRLIVKSTCGGIKASRVILDPSRGGVHRGASAVAHFFLESGQI